MEQRTSGSGVLADDNGGSGVGGRGCRCGPFLAFGQKPFCASSQTALRLVVDDSKDQEKTVWIDDPSLGAEVLYRASPEDAATVPSVPMIEGCRCGMKRGVRKWLESGREVREEEVLPIPAPLAVASLRLCVFVSSE